ncbi:MAG: hypothetical protein ACFB51_08470 [Anaerolineae bacterium]
MKKPDLQHDFLNAAGLNGRDLHEGLRPLAPAAQQLLWFLEPFGQMANQGDVLRTLADRLDEPLNDDPLLEKD